MSDIIDHYTEFGSSLWPYTRYFIVYSIGAALGIINADLSVFVGGIAVLVTMFARYIVMIEQNND